MDKKRWQIIKKNISKEAGKHIIVEEESKIPSPHEVIADPILDSVDEKQKDHFEIIEGNKGSEIMIWNEEHICWKVNKKSQNPEEMVFSVR